MHAANEARLLNEFQRDFPLVREPFALIAHRLGIGVGDVLATLAARIGDGTVSRVGAVFRPGAIGVSTLAAMAVPSGELERVAACVSARPEVNHNYEREHALNLWFVAAAPDRLRLEAALAAIARDTGIEPIRLPLVDDYAIDLGFDLSGAAAHAKPPQPLAKVRRRGPLSPADGRLVGALDDGLPLVAEPYAALARRAGVSQLYAITRLADWLRSGVLKRFGVVVRHGALGYVANAMCVWDVDDANVGRVGAALAQEPVVTLCYRRTRAAPDWPYNLFCMIHGRDRDGVLARLEALARAHGLDRYPSAVLFSRRAFKQCGARYAAAAPDPTPLAA